jgi:hypothetical protein
MENRKSSTHTKPLKAFEPFTSDKSKSSFFDGDSATAFSIAEKIGLKKIRKVPIPIKTAANFGYCTVSEARNSSISFILPTAH